MPIIGRTGDGTRRAFSVGLAVGIGWSEVASRLGDGAFNIGIAAHGSAHAISHAISSQGYKYLRSDATTDRVAHAHTDGP